METQGSFWIKHYSVLNPTAVPFSRNPTSLWEFQSNILVAPVVVLLYSLTASHTGCTAFGWKKSQLCWHWLQSTSEGLLTLLLGLSTRVGLRHTASRQLLLENIIWIQIVSQAIFFKLHIVWVTCLSEQKIWISPSLFTFTEDHPPIPAPPTLKISHSDHSYGFHMAMYNQI